MTKQAKVEVRCSTEEKARWVEAAGGPRSVSAWIRALANSAASASGETGLIEELVTAGAEEKLKAAKTPLSTSGALIPEKKIVEEAKASGVRRAPCPRERFHRSGTYCGACGKLAK
jgi:hypothetical protein